MKIRSRPPASPCVVRNALGASGIPARPRVRERMGEAGTREGNRGRKTRDRKDLLGCEVPEENLPN